MSAIDRPALTLIVAMLLLNFLDGGGVSGKAFPVRMGAGILLENNLVVSWTNEGVTHAHQLKKCAKAFGDR